MIVLGIDPGTASLGYGVVERIGGRLREVDHGCLTTTPDEPLPQRLLKIHTCVTELIETHRPTLVAVERLFFSRNAQTALGVGHARGVVLLAAAQAGLPVREATPSEVKTAVTGSGVAEKEQVGRMVAIIPGAGRRSHAGRRRRRAGRRDLGGQPRAGRGEGTVSTVLDRSAIAPMDGGVTPFERAVREALARERGARRLPRRGRPAGALLADDRLGRWGGSRSSAWNPSSSRWAGSAIGCSRRRGSSPRPGPGSRLKLFTHHLVARGPAGAVRLAPRPRSWASSTCC